MSDKWPPKLTSDSFPMQTWILSMFVKCLGWRRISFGDVINCPVEWRTGSALQISNFSLNRGEMIFVCASDSLRVTVLWKAPHPQDFLVLENEKTLWTRFRKRLKKFPYLTTVGNNSAENTNIASKEFMTENLPIIAKMIRPATKPRQERKQRIFTISSWQKTFHKYVG